MFAVFELIWVLEIFLLLDFSLVFKMCIILHTFIEWLLYTEFFKQLIRSAFRYLYLILILFKWFFLGKSCKNTVNVILDGRPLWCMFSIKELPRPTIKMIWNEMDFDAFINNFIIMEVLPSGFKIELFDIYRMKNVFWDWKLLEFEK